MEIKYTTENRNTFFLKNGSFKRVYPNGNEQPIERMGYYDEVPYREMMAALNERRKAGEPFDAILEEAFQFTLKDPSLEAGIIGYQLKGERKIRISKRVIEIKQK